MKRTWQMLGAALAISVIAGAVRNARAAEKDSDVKAAVVADVTGVKAGEAFTVAVVLTTKPEWHIYWKNPGDAGSATKIKYEVPEGYKVEPMEFPLPVKIVQAGDIVAYGYMGTAVFLAKVTPPKVLAAGEKVEIGVSVSWLCCNDVCIPGGAKLSLELPVSTDVGPAADAEMIAKAKMQIPESEAPAGTATVTPSGSAAGQALTLTWKKDVPRALEVFPLTREGVEVSDVKAETAKNTTVITLHTRLMSGHELKQEKLSLLVVYTDDKGARHGFFTDWDLHSLAANVK